MKQKNNNKLAKDTRLIIVGIVYILLIFGLWNFIRPWIAEYNYRNGFVENTYHRYKNSMIFLDKAMKYAPWETYYLITQVKNYEAMANSTKSFEEKEQWYNKALDAYKFMVKINPSNPWYLNGLASIYLAKYNFSRSQKERDQYMTAAGDAYLSAATIDHNNPLFQMSLAHYYHRTNRIDEAYALYQRCVELDDWFVEAFFSMAEIDLARNNIDQAIINLEGMAKADRENVNPDGSYRKWVKGGDFKNYRFRLAEIYLNQKKFNKAIEFFNWSLEKHDEDAKVWRGLGIAYHQSGNLEKAIYAYKQAISYNPDLNDIYKYLGYLYYNVGLFNSSVANLEKYLKINPNDKKVIKDLKKIKKVRTTYRPTS